MSNKRKNTSWRSKIHQIIYEADTPAGKFFDIALLVVILFSIVLVMLESIEAIHNQHRSLLNVLEWSITILFTVEYLMRIIAVKKPLNYILSFYGIVDLLSTIPKYLSLFIFGTSSLIAIRGLRLLRVFRILKLTRYIGESTHFLSALKRSRVKITVFLSFVMILCIILGTVMYLIEVDKESGFSSIPKSVYWAIVTLTTVGYGDIAPVSNLGQFVASLIMILGYGIIAVPTGIVTAEFTKIDTKGVNTNTQVCQNCNESNHKDGASFCHKCGYKISDE